MKSNVGTIDKVLRVAIAAILAGLAATNTIGWWGWVVAIIPLATGLIGWCPIYSAAGLSTVKK